MKPRLSILAPIAVSALIASASRLPAQSAGSGAAKAGATRLPADSLERARRYSNWVFIARKDSLFASLDSTVMAQLGGSADIFDELTADIAIRAGVEDHVIEERWVNRLGRRQYWRTSKFTIASEPFMLRIVMLPNGRIAGIGFNALSAAPPTDP